MSEEVYIVGSSPMIDRMTADSFTPGAKVAAVSGAAAVLLNRGVRPDMYACLERDNAIIYAGLMERVKLANPACEFYFSKYSHSVCAIRGWNVVPEYERRVLDHPTLAPPIFTTKESKRTRSRYTITGSILLACEFARKARFDRIHFYACEGYPVEGEVYGKGISGASNAFTDRERIGTNNNVGESIDWLSNEFTDIEWIVHGDPLHKRDTWRVTYQP